MSYRPERWASSTLMAASSQTPDARERMAAFLEKRPARYH